MSEQFVLGIDIGGTKIAVGIIDLATRNVVASQFAQITGRKHADSIYSNIVAMCRSLPQLQSIRAIGVCFGGQVYQNYVLRSNQVDGWDDFPLVSRLQREIAPLPVYIINDANAIAWLEWQHLSDKKLSSLFYITVSTGIGGGLIRDGHIVEGRHGLAGEIGHMPLIPNGTLCVCGAYGCLEAIAAGPAISKTYANLTGEQQTAQQIAHLALENDVHAIQALQFSGQQVGRALAMMHSLLDIDHIVIGGGVSRAGDVWWSATLDAFRANLPRWSFEPAISASRFGTFEGLLAAAVVTTINDNKP